MLSRRPSNYITKQSAAVLAYLESQKDSHMTAAQVVEHFEESDVLIGRTTIYRQLEKLVRGGKVRKYVIDGTSGACFQYIDEKENKAEHFHLKCENCGEVFHLYGEILPGVTKNIRNKYEFEVNVNKVIFYGKCSACLRRG